MCHFFTSLDNLKAELFKIKNIDWTVPKKKEMNTQRTKKYLK